MVYKVYFRSASEYKKIFNYWNYVEEQKCFVNFTKLSTTFDCWMECSSHSNLSCQCDLISIYIKKVNRENVVTSLPKVGWLEITSKVFYQFHVTMHLNT